MTADRLTPQREAEIAVWRKRIADLLWWSVPGSTDAEAKATTADLLDKLIAAVSAESAAELAAVRAERDEARARALDALNRSIEDGREVCADCRRPVPDGPCGVHSPDAVYQRAAKEAAGLRAERDALAKRLHDAAMTRTWRNEDGKKFVFVEDIAPALLGLEPGTEAGR